MGCERDREKLNLSVFGMLMCTQSSKGTIPEGGLVSNFGSPLLIGGCVCEELNVQVY